MSTEQKRVAYPVALAGKIPSCKRIRTDDDEASHVDVDSDSASTISQSVRDEPAVNLSCTPGIGQDFMIEELVDSPSFEDLAIEVLKDGEIARILEEFLETLMDHSPHTLRTRALKHFYQAKKVWGNLRFIGLLVKDTLPCSMKRYNLVASRKLAEFLMRKIRSDPSFGDVFKYKDPENMMRSALIIWIGYWSNEYMILLLFDTMGRHALGLNYYVDDCLDVLNEEKTHLASSACPAVEEETAVCSSLIADLRQDESIKTLAEQLLKNPEAVKMAEELLMSLQNDVPVGRLDRYEYHVRHRNAVIRFWFDPLIIVQLTKALKESTHLVNILKKYSKGAQLLRCVERVTRIQRDPLLVPILVGDRAHKMRGALSILFGYWGEIDLSMLLSTILVAQSTNEALAEFDVTEDFVEVLSYLTVGPGDEEGLKNVLADKYPEDSITHLDLFLKIRAYQGREESESDYRASIRFVSVLLKNGQVIYFKMRRSPSLSS